MANKSIPILLVILTILVIVIGYFGFKTSRGTKMCKTDSDCINTNGKYAGCWSIKPRAAIFDTSETKTPGPGDCICHYLTCQSARAVISQVKSTQEKIEICNRRDDKGKRNECMGGIELSPNETNQ